MTRPASVTRGAASLLTSRAAVACIALLFLGVSTRLLTLQEMAVFALYNTLCGMLTVVCSLGLLAACIQKLPGLLAQDRFGEAAGLARVASTVYVLGAALVTASLLIAAEPVSVLILKTPQGAGDVRAAALAALCFGLYEAAQLLLSATQRFGRLGAYNVTAALVQRIVSLVLFFGFGMKGFLAGFALGSLAGAALGTAAVSDVLRGGGAGRESRQTSGLGWIRYSVPFYGDGYLRYLYMQADQLLVGIFLNPIDLSIYFLAKRFLQYCEVLVSSLVTPLGTKISELRGRDPGAIPGVFAASLRSFVLIFLPTAAMLAAISPFLLLMVGGHRYAAALIPLAILFLSLPFFALFSHLATFIYVLGAPRDRLRNNVVSTSVQAVAVLGLMPYLHLVGLAIAKGIGFAGGMMYARHQVKEQMRALPGTGAVSAAVLGLAPTGLMAALIVGPHLLVGEPMLIPLYAAPAGLACLLGYLAFVLTGEERRMLAALVPGKGRIPGWLRRCLAPKETADPSTLRL